MTAAPPRFVLALEGGGSKTTARLTDLDGRHARRGAVTLAKRLLDKA